MSLKLLTRGSKPTSPAYSPSRLMGRLRKGTASEKSPCILRELTAAAQNTKEAHGQPLQSRRLVSKLCLLSLCVLARSCAAVHNRLQQLAALSVPRLPPPMRLHAPSVSTAHHSRSWEFGGSHQCGPWWQCGRSPPWGRRRWPKPQRQRGGRS